MYVCESMNTIEKVELWLKYPKINNIERFLCVTVLLSFGLLEYYCVHDVGIFIYFFYLHSSKFSGGENFRKINHYWKPKNV